MSYIVIFEFTEITGGFSFMRTRIDYANAEEFASLYSPIPTEKVVAQGITEEEANILLCAFPTISIFTAAIENTFKDMPESSELNWDLAEMHMFNANIVVRHHRQLRKSLGVVYSQPANIVEHLAKLADEKTDKGLLMKALIDAYEPNSDFLNYKLAELNLLKVILEITL